MINKRILTLITLLLVLFLLVGCDWFLSNRPPEIESVPVETATVGVDYTYNVIATDPDGDALDYFLTTEPEGMLIGESNGKITWKADDITAAGVGDYDVVVVVSDEGGLSDSQDFTITVSEFVIELIGIEVDPKEMTLPLDAIGTFKVNANYNDVTIIEEVTDFCDYASSDNSIAAVDDAGKVKAIAEGTATISAFYKGKKDTLKVTVGEFVAMEIIADLPTFTAGDDEPAEFTVGFVANSDVDKNVLAYFTLPDEAEVYYWEVAYTPPGWSPQLPAGLVVFGPRDPWGFPLLNVTTKFKATFTTEGTYPTLVEVWEVTKLAEKVELLGYKVITAVVAPAISE